ncbi:MAG TPA: serine/threonine-protein kinase [Terriglobales bacterium]|jgi:eukaryotic-like serine/threonine-protein kinase|nr:serine/threonine-protein kinase [Terriglobales bacterium]
MKWLGDGTVDRLRANMQTPDLSGTRYRAIRFVAGGGMAAIWLADDTVLQRKVALKVLDADDSPDLASRLSREAHILAALEHPGIVPVHDAGTLADGRVFYCMKYVEGQRLDDCLTKVPAIADRVRLLLRIAEPVAFAHSRGIIHRDLKPENVMVGRYGEVLVMDWGLGKILNGAAVEFARPGADADDRACFSANARVTDHGSVLGTPGYMAPEQLVGDIEKIDQRTDIYGLGAILNFMIRGKTADLPQDRRAVRRLRAICAKAMHPDAGQRYRSVEALSVELAKYLADSPVSAYRESPLERLLRVLHRHRTAVILIAVYLLMRLFFILLARP